MALSQAQIKVLERRASRNSGFSRSTDREFDRLNKSQTMRLNSDKGLVSVKRSSLNDKISELTKAKTNRTHEPLQRTQAGLIGSEDLDRSSELKPYNDKCGRSGVVAYKMDQKGIEVHFKDGSTYKYDQSNLSSYMIQKMKTLATEGEGLNRFINLSKAKFAYSEKSR